MADSNSLKGAAQQRAPIFEEMKGEMPTAPFDQVTNGKAGSMPTSPVAAGPRRSNRAKQYESKITDLLSTVMRATAANTATLPDAAALIAHGPILASKVGDLADVDPRVRKTVDFITSGTENPYAALIIATIPLVAQVLRNHEAESTVRVGIRIPFTQRTIRVPFKFALKNKVLRSFTRAPKDLTQTVFEDPTTRAALLDARVEVAYPGYASA